MKHSADTPQVSVIMPTYNHQDFILAALHSVFAQTFSDYEVIVINDGSPDDTAQTVRPLAESGQIRYVGQPNSGQAVARNRGLELARGEYIAFLDDDDLWPPDKLQWQTEFLERNPDAGMVGGTFQTLDEHGCAGYQGKFHPSITFESLFAQNPFLSPGQTLIRADLLRKVGGMNAKIWGADDWDLWFRIAKRSQIVMLDRLALHYRKHPGNSSKQIARLIKGSCDTLELHLKDAAENQRRGLRAAFYCNIYEGLGTRLIGQAKTEFGNRRILSAARLLVGLGPLCRGLRFSKKLRGQVIHDLFLSPLKNRARKLTTPFRHLTTDPSSSRPEAKLKAPVIHERRP